MTSDLAPQKLLLHLVLHIGKMLEDRVAAALASEGLHQGQGRLLDALLRYEPLTISELSVALHIAQPSTTVMLQRMLHSGLIERLRDAKDARIVRLTLTASGNKAALRVQQAWESVDQKLRLSLPSQLAPEDAEDLFLEIRNRLGGMSPLFDHLESRQEHEDPRQTTNLQPKIRL